MAAGTSSTASTHLGFGKPGDPGIEPDLRILSNLEFLKPANNAELARIQKAHDVILAKLRTVDANSTEGRQIIEQVCKHLRPGQEPSLLLAHNALLDLQGNAARFKTEFAYANTSFAQSIIGGMVSNLNKNAPQAIPR